jgi:hypothetical protein
MNLPNYAVPLIYDTQSNNTKQRIKYLTEYIKTKMATMKLNITGKR